MSRVFRGSLMILAVVGSLGLQSGGAWAQSVSTWVGGNTTNSSTNQFWTLASAWQPAGVPTGTNAWAQLNSSTTGLMRILYSSTSLNGGVSGTSLTVGAISLLPTMVLPSGTFAITNQGTSAPGTIKFYGIDTTIDGTARRIILDNRSPATNVTFTGSSTTLKWQEFELYTSGAINVSANTQLTLNPRIRDGGGPQSITKIGDGILTFTGSSEQNTFAGGFVMGGGIVQWATSGVSGTNPFGAGSLTLRSGTLRSTSATGKSINSSVVLDGAVTLGSADPTFNGNITVNSSGGALATTIASDSVVTIAGSGSTAWNQSTSGTGSLTKAGPGLLRFTTLSTLAHTGSTTVQEGTLIMVGSMASASGVSVLNGAALFGTGTIAGPTSIFSGGTFSPGAVSGTAGVFTFGSGGLSLAGQTLMEVAGTTRGTQYDGVDVGGPLAYGGPLLLQFSGTVADNTTLELFRGFTSQAGSFSSITVTGSYAGSLTESSGVWTGRLGGQDFTFTNSTGSLVIIPEPTVSLLAALGVTAAAVQAWRRGRRPPV